MTPLTIYLITSTLIVFGSTIDDDKPLYAMVKCMLAPIVLPMLIGLCIKKYYSSK